MRQIVAFVFSCLICAASSLHAQVTPSAYRGQLSLTAGGIGSVFQPDYAGGGLPQASPQRLFGAGFYVDLKMTRWIQVEGEARWLRENSYLDITQDNYLIGPRVPIHEFKRLGITPYGKALVGLGRMTFEYNEAYGRFTNVALGGGVDLKVTRRLSVRPVDFEYQLWPNWINGTLKPYGFSAGIGYKIF
ncbi:MAG: outer membrane beta-barrel protein [Terracidiphilus sp.]